MIRAKYKDEQYFSVLIDQLIARAQKYEFRRDEFPNDSIQFEKCQIHLHGIYNDLIYALYSSGASFEEIKPYVKKYMASITPSSLSYYLLIDTYAFAVLFDLEIPKTVSEQNKYHDLLIDSLQSISTPHISKSAKKETLFPQYQPFLDYLTDKTNQQTFIEYVENEWYSSCSDCAWFESHKNTHNVYVGYWCWIAAALLKLKGASLDTETGFKYIPQSE